MASNDPGLGPASRPAEDPRVPHKDGSISIQDVDNSSNDDGNKRYPHCPPTVAPDTSPIAPDQFDPTYATSKYEIWAYYTYYIGNNGLTLFNFAPTQFQNLMSQALPENSTTLPFAGSQRTIYSIVLLSNGISFAIQIAVFLILGSFADFGSWRPNILIVLSLVAYGIGFGWLGVHTPDKWHIGVGLYIVGLIAYQTTLTFWTAAFPGLARNTQELRDKAAEFENRECSREEYDELDTMVRSRIANVAFYVQSCGEVVILAIIVGILWGVNVDASVQNNNLGLSVLIAFATGVWLLLGIPWFIIEKRRPGLDPQGNIVIAGIRQLWLAITKIWRLKQSLFYLIGYFLLGDSLNTTVTVISTLQNNIVSYNTLTLTYVLIAGIAAQAVGIFVFWNVQKRFRLGTKTMFNAVAIGIILLDGWGFIGIFTDKFGFKHVWEVWAYQVFYGLAVCPWYSYSQIMISEVTPRGYEFLFFSLFSIIGKTSSFIGPFVSAAIIDDTPNHNPNSPFYFLLSLSVASFVFLFFVVDLKKSRMEQASFLEEEELRRAQKNAALSAEDGEEGSSGEFQVVQKGSPETKL